MLTLTKSSETRPICSLVKGKKRHGELLWHPRREETLRNQVDDLSGFNTQYLRDKFELSREQAASVFKHLQAGTVDTAHQKPFFKVKKYINTSLYTEVDLTGTDLRFRIEFEHDVSRYSGHELIVAGTGAGKTSYFKNRCLQNLQGPKSRRRKFLIFSAEWHSDKTLAELKKERYQQHVTGVDCGEAALGDSMWHSEEEFFQNEIRARVQSAEPGTVILFDDAREIVNPQGVRHLIDKTLRTGRHQGHTLMVILHNLRSGAWSSQAYSSVKYLTVFPRSQKAKIINFLNRDQGLPLGEARDHVYAFGQSGRTMSVRMHAPECLIGPKMVRLL